MNAPPPRGVLQEGGYHERQTGMIERQYHCRDVISRQVNLYMTSYCFIHHIQGNIIFCSIHTIFDKRLFPKYTDSHAKEYKLYNKLLNEISLKTELSISNSSRKNEPALIPIPSLLYL